MRTESWTNNLSVSQCDKMLSGAVRESSLRKRQEFEVGNWQGQRLKGDLKFYDNVYKRKYAPEAVKAIDSKIDKITHPQTSHYDPVGEKGGDATQRWQKSIRGRSQVRESQNQRFCFGNISSHRKVNNNSQLSHTKRSNLSKNSARENYGQIDSPQAEYDQKDAYTA